MYFRIVLYVLIAVLGWIAGGERTGRDRRVMAAPAPMVVTPPLRGYAERAIQAANPNISPARRHLLAGLIVSVGETVFRDRERQEYWVVLVGIESGYNPAAVSSTGAVGLGQLIVRYRNDFGRTCGVTDVAPEDVRDDYVNLYLSACYFRELVEQHGGNIPLALVSYNQGPNSKDAAKAKAGMTPSHEPAGHVARAAIKKAKLDKDQQ